MLAQQPAIRTKIEEGTVKRAALPFDNADGQVRLGLAGCGFRPPCRIPVHEDMPGSMFFFRNEHQLTIDTILAILHILNVYSLPYSEQKFA